MTSIRLKVQLLDDKSSNSFRKTSVVPLKFIYVLESSSDKTINDLRQLLEKHINRQYSNKIQIVRLMTDDGYHLSNEDYCSAVLKDNDRILCYDMDNFIQENYSTLDYTDLWCEMKQHDASDNQEKYIQVGLTNTKKLFIRIYGTSKVYGLYIYNVFQLIDIACDYSRDVLIARLGQENWFIEAKWEYDGDSQTSLFLICSLKLGASEQIWSNQLKLLLDESQMSIEKGEITCLSGGINDENVLTEQQRERLKELASNIPPRKYTGPQIDIEKDANKTITKHECQGDSLVRMTYGNTNKVTVFQNYYVREDGTFQQHFVITHINFSQKSADDQSETSSKKPLSVVNINVFYQNNDETWSECKDIAIGPISFLDEQPAWLANTNIKLEPDQPVSYAIKGSIVVKGQPGRDNAQRSRIHKNLPQPLKLKIVIQDNFNKQSSLIVEQLNKPLDIDTSTSFAKYNQSSINELVAFVFADDCDSDERIFLAVYLDKEDRIVINSNQSCSIILDRKYIRTMEFDARQNKTAEVAFDSIYSQQDGQEKKATGLFDPETFMFYAIRLEVATKTSKCEETAFIPRENVK